MDLFTFDQMKSLLGLEGSDISEYPDLELIASLVTPRIEEFLGKFFEEEKRTISFYNENPTKLVSLKGLPVKNVSVLKLNGTDITGYTITGYGLRLSNTIGAGEVECTYVGGLPDVPSWLNRAAILQTAYEYQSKDNIGASFVATEGGNVSRPALNLLDDVKAILKPHIHPLERFN